MRLWAVTPFPYLRHDLHMRKGLGAKLDSGGGGGLGEAPKLGCDRVCPENHTGSLCLFLLVFSSHIAPLLFLLRHPRNFESSMHTMYTHIATPMCPQHTPMHTL